MNYTEIEELLGLGGDASPIMMLVWILPVILLVFYGQRIQLLVTSGEIRKNIKKLDQYGSHSLQEAISHAQSVSDSGDIEYRVQQMVDYFTIPPVDMDPAGVVDKVRHVVRTREAVTRHQIDSIIPEGDYIARRRMQTLLEVAASLRLIYRIVNHLYLTAKKQKNYPLILPLQMMLPSVMEEAGALRDGTDAFRRGLPVGDAVGPIVVGMMMRTLDKRDIAFETVSAEDTLEGRHLVLVKARGPAPVVGRPEEALHTLLEEGVVPNLIVMVDAALKMEGELSGTIHRGFGAAIGGTGTERFQIEEYAVQRGIPVLCVVVKQSVKESVNLMSRPIYDAISEASTQLRDTILESSKPSDTILVIGVGNTGGVIQ